MTKNLSGTHTAILKQIISPLLLWYKNQARILPWREEATPYRVWVSEIMLQQTRVAAVLPYFERFIAALPDVKSLAEADETMLMKLWEGLGYYSRARNLQKAAQQIQKDYQGVIPYDFNELLKLPGIGRYTAGAVSSIAYAQRHPAVDGNVLRVIMRITACNDDILKESTKRAVEQALLDVMPADLDAGTFNQALMELGAMTCLPKKAAHCPQCPLIRLCLAFDQGTTAALPCKSPAKKRRIEKHTILLLEANGKFAIRQRPPKGLLSGLWELPNLTGHLSKSELSDWLRARELTASSFEPMASAKHIFSHLEWHMVGWHVILSNVNMVKETIVPYSPSSAEKRLLWLTPSELSSRYSIPSAFQYFLHLKNSQQ
jgi:A/G-specific adenine glycosylase